MQFKLSKAKILQSSELPSPLGGDGTEQPGDKAVITGARLMHAAPPERKAVLLLLC